MAITGKGTAAGVEEHILMDVQRKTTAVVSAAKTEVCVLLWQLAIAVMGMLARVGYFSDRAV